MWWLLLWPLLGFLGWVWAFYTIHTTYGPEEATHWSMWVVLVYALVVGPLLIWTAYKAHIGSVFYQRGRKLGD